MYLKNPQFSLKFNNKKNIVFQVSVSLEMVEINVEIIRTNWSSTATNTQGEKEKEEILLKLEFFI
jgi:hypothetical protein